MRKLSPPIAIPERPSFVGFDVSEPARLPGYRRNLPHLRLEGATYFVTFRLADSIPESVAERWRMTEDRWLRDHGVEPAWQTAAPDRWYVAYSAIPEESRRAFERETHRRFFAELDKCHGSCLLQESHDLVATALEFFHGQRIWIGDYVVMPNHVHALVQPFPGVKLQDWLYSVKRYTATRMRRTGPVPANEHQAIWQGESFDRVVRDSAELARTRQYIASNPAKLRAGTYALKLMDWLDTFAVRPKLEP